MDLRPFMERWHMLPPSGGVMLVAVSGGRDSVCLLHYLAAMPRDFSVAAAHLDHGQRPTAGRDVAFVEELCRELDVPLTVERADVPALARERGVGLEEAGRMARYDFFRRTADRLGAQRIATAHHAADQAETVVLNLVRGTGMQGLAGIPPVRGRIVRPLLETSREEIETYLEVHRLSHVEDETNRDTALRRNLLRREVMPRLAELHDGAAANICRTAELLRQEDGAILAFDSLFCSQTGFADDDVAARKVGKSLAAKLGEVLGRIDHTLYDGLILVGGDTAVAVCRSLQTTQLLLLEEVQSGTPAGLLADGPLRGIPVVTKSGAFGDEDTLLHAWKYIRREGE